MSRADEEAVLYAGLYSQLSRQISSLRGEAHSPGRRIAAHRRQEVLRLCKNDATELLVMHSRTAVSVSVCFLPSTYTRSHIRFSSVRAFAASAYRALVRQVTHTPSPPRQVNGALVVRCFHVEFQVSLVHLHNFLHDLDLYAKRFLVSTTLLHAMNTQRR